MAASDRFSRCLGRLAASVVIGGLFAGPSLALELDTAISDSFSGKATAVLTLAGGGRATIRFDEFFQEVAANGIAKDEACAHPQLTLLSQGKPDGASVEYTLRIDLWWASGRPLHSVTLGQYIESGDSVEISVDSDDTARQSEGAVTREGAIWPTNLEWDFSPEADTYWLDPQTGRPGSEISRVLIATAVDMPARYFDLHTNSFKPCP